MSLPSTGEIKFSQIQTVFGGANPVSFSEYFTNANTSYTSGVSGLPAIGSSMSISGFRGKSKFVLNLYTFATHLFTNAGVTGQNGPTLSQCRTTYSSASWSQDTINNYLDMTSQGIQLWKVPTTGTYIITVAGAAGGGATQGYTGGAGYVLQSQFSLTQGQVLSIVVGQTGSTNSIGNSGGGGGSFVVLNGSALIVAGGGGGAGSIMNGVNGNSTSSGFTPYLATTTAGTNGNGASGGTDGSGAGNNGGGFSTNGTNGGGYTPNTGTNLNGKSFQSGSTGGVGAGNTIGAFGGFGGGACGYLNGTTYNVAGGGGGGGYSGGSGGSISGSGGGGGGGGGSYSTSAILNNGFNTGAGYVIITSSTSSSTASDITQYRNYVGISFTVKVTGATTGGNVWGTNIYTDDSSIGMAAVHSGVLASGQTALVTVTILGAQSSFAGSSRNGVTSSSFGYWQGSYSLKIRDVLPSGSTNLLTTNELVEKGLPEAWTGYNYEFTTWESFTKVNIGSTTYSGLVYLPGSSSYNSNKPYVVFGTNISGYGLFKSYLRSTASQTYNLGSSGFTAVFKIQPNSPPDNSTFMKIDLIGYSSRLGMTVGGTISISHTTSGSMKFYARVVNEGAFEYQTPGGSGFVFNSMMIYVVRYSRSNRTVEFYRVSPGTSPLISINQLEYLGGYTESTLMSSGVVNSLTSTQVTIGIDESDSIYFTHNNAGTLIYGSSLTNSQVMSCCEVLRVQ